MDYQALWNEIQNDPLGRGYNGMTDEQIADDMNTLYRSENIEILTGDQVFESTNSAEFQALTDHQQSLWMSLCARNELDPFGSANVALATFIFGGGSVTLSNLQDVRTRDISRAHELLGIFTLKVGHIQQARLQFGG